MVNQKKLKQSQIYQKLLKESQNFLVIGFKKTTHQNLEKLRKELKKSHCLLKIIKNTIFEKTINKILKENKLFTQIKKNFFPIRETSALIAIKSSDYSLGLKTFYNFLKKDNNFYFKFAILENNLFDSIKLEEIAQMPSKNDLSAKIIFLMKLPTQRFNLALKYNLIKLINILKEKTYK